MKPAKELIMFQGNKIRRVKHNKEWHFSVIDIISILTESPTPRRYWSDLKANLKKEGFEMYGNIVQLKLQSSDRKRYSTDCINTQNAFRLIQSIPSKKVEPFKRWLAQIGQDRIKEAENPALMYERMKDMYRIRGYPEEWIDKRIRSIQVRQELTDEWHKRGVEDQKYGILTNEIMKAAFGLTTKEYKEHKGLGGQSLRDHMDTMELVLTMLGEATTTRLTQGRNSNKFFELRKDAKDGGEITGKARTNIEKKIGQGVVSKHNYLGRKERKELAEIRAIK